MDLIIFIILCGVVVFFFKRFSSFIYFLAITDIFLRLVTFIKVEITSGDVYSVLDKYIPSNIPDILSNYSSGLLYDVFLWLYVIAFIIFEYYIIKTFFRKK